MKSKNPMRIHIIGSVGSGKTTLAKNLSHQLNIPYYELDNVVWKRFDTGDVRRNPKEREEYFRSIVTSDPWIIEGVHNEEWVIPSFEHAEVIIFLNTNFQVRNYRIIKRFILQKLCMENLTINQRLLFSGRCLNGINSLKAEEQRYLICWKYIVISW